MSFNEKDVLRRSPPDLLAAIAGTLLDAYGDPALRWAIDRTIEAFESGSYDRPPQEEWAIEPAEICEQALALLSGSPLEKPESRLLHRWISALQLLDEWHAPILPHNAGLEKLAAHFEMENRLYEREPRLNLDASLGLVIPGKAATAAFLNYDDEEPGRDHGLLLGILGNVAYLPPTILAADPDREPGPCRPIHLTYRRARASVRSVARLNDVRVGIAPMAESIDDVLLKAEGRSYGIMPVYAPERIDEALRKALQLEVHILCIPEMGIDEANVDRLKSAIVEERRAFAKLQRKPPALRYVLTGVIAQSEGPQERHHNYILILDADGNVISSQSKLTHWNLEPGQLARFGLRDRFDLDVPLCAGEMLYENTREGGEIIIVDLDDLGRFLSLICADMNKDKPGDWLLENFRIDWLYAPIMDGSTCWTQGGAPWIIRRAARAAQLGRARVVVSNSMTMTHWNNVVIGQGRASDPAYPFLCYDHCGIGLLLDGSGVPLRQQHVSIPIDRIATPVVECRSWASGWSNYCEL